MKKRTEDKPTGALKRGYSASKSYQMIIKSKKMITFANCKGISGLKQKCQAITGQTVKICKEILGQVMYYEKYIRSGHRYKQYRMGVDRQGCQ
jgi:hypothetical protein